MLNKLRLILLPFNLIYGLIVVLRNKFYDWGLFKSTSFDLPVIGVGNLVVGGSGKTPTTEYIVNLLKDKYKVAILSRGYGRKTKGFILADASATAASIGDEPLQYYHKFKDVTVAVCESRVKGISQLQANHDVIILDDAYQHRAVKIGFSILLFEFEGLKKRQFLMPAGNLREPMAGVNRAEAVLVTKSPAHIAATVRTQFATKLQLQKHQQLAFASIGYLPAKALYGSETFALQQNCEVLLLTGIANPVPLKHYIESLVAHVHAFEFPDHHAFSVVEIERVVQAFAEISAKEKIIITTEKDGQRLLASELKDLLLNLPVYYLPIHVNVQVEDKAVFDEKILTYVERTRRISKVY